MRPKGSKLPLRGRYRLLIIGDQEHRTLRLPPVGELSIGRSEAADVQIVDPLMSRVHASVIVKLDGGLFVHDRGSSNGTLVRGERIESNAEVPISVGDTIEVGSTVVLVQPEFAPGKDLARPAPTDATLDPNELPMGDAMARVHKLARRIAHSQRNLLLLGETGVGKEVMARMVHRLSARCDGPFVGINCAAVSGSLFESELFGFEKGAFTGATQAKPGLIETAHHGTMFLDEVGEMPTSTQVKLLRVLETREVLRVGGLRPHEIDVRFVAATNQNLERDVERGEFREDLYYRLNGISLVIPPLRMRGTELPRLAQQFLSEATREAGLPEAPVFSPEAQRWMGEYAWPGNIRELRNAVNRAVILAASGVIEPEHLEAESYQPRTGHGSGRGAQDGTAPTTEDDAAPPSLSEADALERQRIIDALAACGGNQTRAAKTLGIARRTLTTRLEKLSIPRPRKGR